MGDSVMGDAAVLLYAIFPNWPSNAMDLDSAATPAREDTAHHAT